MDTSARVAPMLLLESVRNSVWPGGDIVPFREYTRGVLILFPVLSSIFYPAAIRMMNITDPEAGGFSNALQGALKLNTVKPVQFQALPGLTTILHAFSSDSGM